MTAGRVRVLPPLAPGVPPPVPTDACTGRYRSDLACRSTVDPAEVPDGHRLAGDSFVVFYCTRPVHDEGEPHACHLRDGDAGSPRGIATIVWGGE
jgi:hypothetical protein